MGSGLIKHFEYFKCSDFEKCRKFVRISGEAYIKTIIPVVNMFSPVTKSLHHFFGAAFLLGSLGLPGGLPAADLTTERRTLSFSEWQNEHFDRDPALAPQMADPDNDGLVNLLAYALGYDLQDASTFGEEDSLPTASYYQSLPFYRVRLPAALLKDLLYEVQMCVDLTASSWKTVKSKVAERPWEGSSMIVSSAEGVNGRDETMILGERSSDETRRAVFRLVVSRRTETVITQVLSIIPGIEPVTDVPVLEESVIEVTPTLVEEAPPSETIPQDGLLESPVVSRPTITDTIGPVLGEAPTMRPGEAMPMVPLINSGEPLIVPASTSALLLAAGNTEEGLIAEPIDYVVRGGGRLQETVVDLSDVVLIPEGTELIVDHTLTARTLAVSGKLTVLPGARLYVETIRVLETGHLEARGGDIEFIFSGRANTDAGRTGLGIVSNGTVDLIGNESPSHATSATGATKGSRVITVGNASGWQVGDQVAFPDVHGLTTPRWKLDGNPSLYDDKQTEIKTITANAGTRVTLDSPLSADHLTLGQQGPVAHLSRPIKLRTASGSPERAHAMFIGKTRVNAVEFIDMGRTTAEELDTTNNVIGRYPCHAHFSPDFEFTHVTVHASSEDKEGSPRHGIVHHSSYGNVRNCVVVNAQSSSFFFEDGDGGGEWSDNVAYSGGSNYNYEGDDGRFGSHEGRELGAGPSGYWLRGHQVTIDRCEAYGVAVTAFATFTHSRFNRDPKAPNQALPRFDRCFAYGNFLTALIEIQYNLHTKNVLTNFTGVNLLSSKDGKGGWGLAVIHSNEFHLKNCEFIGSGGEYGASTFNGENGRLILENTSFTGFRNVTGRWPKGVQD